MLYSFISEPLEGFVIAKKGTNFIFRSIDGMLGTEKVFDYVSFSKLKSRSLILAQKNNLWGYLNKKGEIIIPFKYEKARNFNGNHAKVMKDGVSFLLNKKGIRVTKNIIQTE